MLMERYCIKCNATLTGNSKYCASCGEPVPQEESGESFLETTQTTKTVLKPKRVKGMSPLKYLLSGVSRLVKGYALAFRNKRFIIVMILMAAVWTVLSILPLYGNNTKLVRTLNYLTFANGGLGSGWLGAAGGIFGKVVYAYLVLPLVFGQNPFKGIGKAVKCLPKAFAFKGGKSTAPLLAGCGLAFIAYNFMNGNASIQNSMVAIAAFFLTLRALGRKEGFLKGFVKSVMDKYFKRGSDDGLRVDRIFYGMAAGFLLSILFSLIKVNSICYLAGLVFVLSAFIVSIAGKLSNREVAA